MQNLSQKCEIQARLAEIFLIGMSFAFCGTSTQKPFGLLANCDSNDPPFSHEAHFRMEKIAMAMPRAPRQPSPTASTNPDPIRLQTAQIRCGWTDDEYRRRRQEARWNQQKLFGLAPSKCAALPLTLGQKIAAQLSRW